MYTQWFKSFVCEIHTLEPQINPCYGYVEQQENSCYGIYSNKEIHAKGNLNNKEIHAPCFRDQDIGNLGFKLIFRQNLKKTKMLS